MVKIRKYANGIERFLHGEKGQRFFNFAYSIGAAVVIWGALFKILHLPGGSTLLCIGMGTEIAMFILTAFDRPPKEYHWEDVFPVLDTHNPADRPSLTGGVVGGMPGGVVVNGVAMTGDVADGAEYTAPEHADGEASGEPYHGPAVVGGGGPAVIGGGVIGGGPAVIGGGVIGGGVIGGGPVVIGGGAPADAGDADVQTDGEPVEGSGPVVIGGGVIGGGPAVIGGGGPAVIGGGGPAVIGGGVIGGGGGGTVIINGGGNATAEGGEAAAEGANAPGEGGVTFAGGGVIGGGSGPVVISGGGGGSVGGILPPGTEITSEEAETLRDSIKKMAEAGEQIARMGELAETTRDYLEQMQAISSQMATLRQTTGALNEVSETLLAAYRTITDNSTSVSDNAAGYVERMADLNRNIGGLNTIYEIQLKSVSTQLESIDRVNRGLKDIRDMYEKSAAESSRYCEETEKMARYMKQLNSVYEKMITAMTINMYNPMMGAQGQAPANPFAAAPDPDGEKA